MISEADIELNFDKICRACMNEKSELKSLFDACLPEMWAFSTSLDVSVRLYFHKNSERYFIISVIRKRWITKSSMHSMHAAN